MVRLSAQDQDQEVKECAISCMATAVALLGNHLTGKMEQVGSRSCSDNLKSSLCRASVDTSDTCNAAVRASKASRWLQVLQVLLERLRNEITRLTAVKAFSTIAASPINLDLGAVLLPVVVELTSFLRKVTLAVTMDPLLGVDQLGYQGASLASALEYV